MHRLNKDNINTPELSDRIFKERWAECPHWVDYGRFKLMTKYYTGGHYLDVGCFNNPILFELAEEFPDATIEGLDHAPRVIERMQELFPKVVYTLSGLDLPHKDKTVDYLVAGELIEHVEDPTALIKEFVRVVKKEGWIVVSTPLEDKGGITDEHVWSFTAEDVLGLFEPYGVSDYIVVKQGFDTIIVWSQIYDHP